MAWFNRICPFMCLMGALAWAPCAQAKADWWSLDFLYTGDLWSAVDGGLTSEARQISNVDIIFDADLEKAGLWRGGRAYVYGLYNNGTSFTRAAGDGQIISNTDAGVEAFWLYEAWLEQAFGDAATLKVGLYDLNAEFDQLTSANLFIHSAHGIGTVYGLSGRNGPSIFPFTSLSARLEAHLGEDWTTRIAILDGVPGDPNRLSRTTIQLGDGDGILIAAELEKRHDGGKVLAGYWGYTSEFTDFSGDTRRGNQGAYVRGEHRLYSDARGGGLDGFVRFGTGNGAFNQFNRFIGAGLVYTGPMASRPKDQVGIALATAFTSNALRRTRPAENSETALELIYSAPLTPWLTVQPDIQYIINPAATPGRKNVLALGLRVKIGYSF